MDANQKTKPSPQRTQRNTEEKQLQEEGKAPVGHCLLIQKISQAVIPGYLVGESEVCVGGAWIRDYEKPGVADGFRLWTQNSRNARNFERSQAKWPVSCEAMKASHTRRIMMQFLQKNWDPSGEVTPGELRCIARWALNHVCKSDSESRQIRIVFRQERINPELPPHPFTQPGARECRPETASGASKVMSATDRVEAGIDPDKNEIESRTKMVRQGRKVVLLRHRLHDWLRIQGRLARIGFLATLRDRKLDRLFQRRGRVEAFDFYPCDAVAFHLEQDAFPTKHESAGLGAPFLRVVGEWEFWRDI
jgi:hypothetical protein